MLVLGALAFAPPVLAAQGERPADVRRPQATRTELAAAQSQLEQVVASPGYSKSLRKAKQAELDLVRQRLAEGDFQVGDQVDAAVVGEASVTGKFPVWPDRVLSFPTLPPVSLQGVLRSEIKDYLTAQIGRYVKTPQLVIQGSYIRVAVLGTVGKPGYYSFPADNLVSDVIMTAGGPGANKDMAKSVVRRNGKEVIPEGGLQRAIEAGQSLDQLNLHGGDEIYIKGTGGNNNGNGQGSGIKNWIWPLQGLVGLTYLLIRVL